MNLREALRAGAREISANKFRSALSFTAVSVGVASLLYTTAQTRGMQEALALNLELMGPGRMTVEKKQNYVSRGLSSGLTYADAAALRRELPDLYMVEPHSSSWGSNLVFGRTTVRGVRAVGTTPEFRRRDWVYSLRGRFINEWDVAHRARVVVMVEPAIWIKKPFWAKYWSRENPYDAFVKRRDLLGQRIRLEDSVFTVVGVMTPPPRDKDPRWNSWGTPNAVVPITAFQESLERSGIPDGIDEIRIDTGDEKTLSSRRRQVEAILKRRHRGEEDFDIKDEREAIEADLAEMRKNAKTGLVLGLVALLAGGIGIMNVTLATIFARVREIGIRRAIGASRGDILALFLIEAAMLGAAGGAAGVALGLGGVKWLATLGGSRKLAEITWLQCAEGVALAALVSAAFALIPAYRASRLDPVEALRAE